MTSTQIWPLLLALRLLAGVLTLPSTSGAQTAQDDTPRASTAANRLRELSDRLNLTDEQKAKIGPILQDEAQQLEQKDSSLSPEDRMSRLRRIHVATTAKIRELLSEEQRPLFDQMEKARLDSMQWKPQTNDSEPSR